MSVAEWSGDGPPRLKVLEFELPAGHLGGMPASPQWGDRIPKTGGEEAPRLPSMLSQRAEDPGGATTKLTHYRRVLPRRCQNAEGDTVGMPTATR